MHENSWVDNVIWGLLLLLVIPSSVVVFSWNSLAGSRLFKVKLAMEKALLSVAPTQQTRGDLHVAFTERRFSEATKLIADNSSTEGLKYLNAEILSAQASIEKAPTSEAKKQVAKKYVATLRNMNSQLEQQRQVMATQSEGNSSQVQQPTIIIIQQITQTQEQITQTIEQVEQDEETVEPTPSPTSKPKLKKDNDNEKSDYQDQIKANQEEKIEKQVVEPKKVEEDTVGGNHRVGGAIGD